MPRQPNLTETPEATKLEIFHDHEAAASIQTVPDAIGDNGARFGASFDSMTGAPARVDADLATARAGGTAPGWK